MKINRRKFLKNLSNLIWLGFGYLIFKSTGRTLNDDQQKKIKIFENEFPEGVTILDGYIFFRNGKTIKVLKSSCTHLGCNVYFSSDKNLICPCHGSKFQTDGKVIEGPAQKNLEEAKFKLNLKKNQIIVYG